MKKCLLLLIIILSISCSNDDNSNGNRLQGKWSLVNVTGGIAGSNAPQPMIQKTILEFSGTKIKTYAAEELIDEKKFYIAVKKSIFGGDREMIVIDKGLSITQEVYIDQSFEIKGKKLFLIQECTDCLTLEYERVK